MTGRRAAWEEMGLTMGERRLFVALTFSEAERDWLVQRQDALKGHIATSRLTAPGNLHMTLSFIGPCDEDQETLAREALDVAVTAYRNALADKGTGDSPIEGTDGAGRPERPALDPGSFPIDLALGHISCFEKRRNSILWVGPTDSGCPQRLGLLQELVADELRVRGLPYGGETFRPHVTLARNVCVPKGVNLAELCATLTSESGSFTTRHTSASLMWSDHPKGGSLTYTPIKTVTL